MSHEMLRLFIVNSPIKCSYLQLPELTIKCQ